MTLTVLSIIFTLILTIVLPIAIIIYLFKKETETLKWALIGGLVFFLFQILIRIPLLNYLTLQPWFIVHITTNTIGYATFLALTAGLFEEGGRYLTLRFALKDKINWLRGLAFGVGHGGVEAIYLVGLPFLQQVILQWTGDITIQTIIPPSTILLAGLERILAMTMHVGFSMIVLYGVKRKKPIYLLYAILAHALVNFPLGLFKNPLFIWTYLILWTGVLLYVINHFRTQLDRQWFMD